MSIPSSTFLQPHRHFATSLSNQPPLTSRACSLTMSRSIAAAEKVALEGQLEEWDTQACMSLQNDVLSVSHTRYNPYFASDDLLSSPLLALFTFFFPEQGSRILTKERAQAASRLPPSLQASMMLSYPGQVLPQMHSISGLKLKNPKMRESVQTERHKQSPRTQSPPN